MLSNKMVFINECYSSYRAILMLLNSCNFRIIALSLRLGRASFIKDWITLAYFNIIYEGLCGNVGKKKSGFSNNVKASLT